MNENMLCVADGVGGWAESGIDPAIYSKRLCLLIDQLYASGNDRYLYNPKELLVDAVKENQEVGSCTCVILTLDTEAPVIQTVNLGDSGYMILRKEATKDDLSIEYESKEQQHSFNFPFQVGTNGDDPKKGETNAHKVMDGDILIVGSDGLWDNMHRHKIVSLIGRFTRETPTIKDMGLVAEMIAKEAEKLSYLSNHMSPFAESARAHNYDYVGGKPDDITVIVAQIQLKNSKE